MCISGIDRLNPAAILAAVNRYSRRLHIVRPRELSCAGLVFAICFAAFVPAFAAGQREVESLRVAVYNVPPYAYVDADGSISGVSVDLWRRVAEQMEWHYQLIPISEMESILSGLEQGRFDAAIGAITITPERAARVDFSYPAHRSGVAIALKKETGLIFALVSYGAAVSELVPLIIITHC
jgi:polar amino acid transport system substrate-binding protein